MIVFATTSTPRLQHVVAWLGNYLFGSPLIVITDKNKLQEIDVILNYSQLLLPFTCFHLQPHTLLFEVGIQFQDTEIKHSLIYPYFFATIGDFRFDILAASFYLIQRYEEYLPTEKDRYGRYAYTNSIAFKNNFLDIPLVDMWMQHFKSALQEKFRSKALQFAERRFQFTPTYDVDIAYSYRGKGWLRNAGGLLRSLLKLQIKDGTDRIQVLITGKKDPFDVFDELNALHHQYHLQPIYFFLLAQRQKGVDRNIHPAKKIYQKLIQSITAQYETGIHLSAAASGSPVIMQTEKKLLTDITLKEITANRNHYLLFTLPDTYDTLQKKPLLIDKEYSMGYGTANGFRASVCTPYYWYNLQAEQSTRLQVFPFCYMEANAIFQLNQTPQQALEEMKQLYENVKRVDGLFITIFHNHLIGRDVSGRQWMKMYKQFLNNI